MAEKKKTWREKSMYDFTQEDKDQAAKDTNFTVGLYRMATGKNPRTGEKYEEEDKPLEKMKPKVKKKSYDTMKTIGTVED
jgi:hypothetical protein